MDDKYEQLAKYFKSHHRKVVENNKNTESLSVYAKTDGQSIAYEHIIDILSDEKLREKELSKFEK